jgi:hypothetical protein
MLQFFGVRICSLNILFVSFTFNVLLVPEMLLNIKFCEMYYIINRVQSIFEVGSSSDNDVDR